ncbi:MAG: hypothetical protein HKN26_06330, partial [Acidimicrobiales bacterium]|nr:hypothetical protein [Acidimicrobiales bacterium]
MQPTSRFFRGIVVGLAVFSLLATSCVAIVLPQPGQQVSLPYTIRGLAVQDDSVTAVKLRIFDDVSG